MKQRCIQLILIFIFLFTAVYFTTAQMSQWSKLYTYPEGGNIKDIASDNSGKIYVLAGFQGTIYYTQDSGQSWSRVPGTEAYWNILDIEVDKSNGSLYVGTTGEGIFWTPDLGNTWHVEYITTDPVSGFHASFLAVGAKNNGNTVVGSDADFVSTRIYTTTNAGNSWSVYPNAPFGGALDFEFLPGGELLAATEKGVFKSLNNGASWTALNTGISNMQTRSVVSMQSNGYLFAGTDINVATGDTTGTGVYISVDNGTTWTLSSNGITNRKVRTLLADNTTGNIYAGTEGGLFMSANNGASWSAVNLNLQSLAITGLTRNASGLFSASEKSGVAFSENPSAGWTYKNTGLSVNTIGDMAMDNSSSFYLIDEEVSGIYKTTLTNNWQQAAANQLPAFFGKKIINHNDTLYATFSTQRGFPKSGLFASTDHGMNWMDISTNIPIPASVAWVSFDDIEVADGVVYVYVNSEVFRSTDFGASWVSIRQGLVRDIDLAPDGTLYLTTLAVTLQIRFEYSTNQGASFNSISTGSMFLTENADLVINKTGALYIKDNGNIYRQNGPGSWPALPNGGWSSNFINLYFDNVNAMYVSALEEGVFYSANGSTWSNISAGIPHYNSSASGTVLLTLTDFLFDHNNVPYARSADAEAGIVSGIYRLGNALPLTFLGINAVKTNNGQLVSWKVANELNTYSYELQRSNDGRTFYKTAGIDVAGIGSAEQDYDYKDPQPFSGIVYYRVKALYDDGNSAYSSIARLKTEKANMQIAVSPNPITNGLLNLTIENAVAGDCEICIFDNAGRKLFTDKFFATEGTMVYSRSSQALTSKGSYTLLLKTNNQTLSKRILVGNF